VNRDERLQQATCSVIELTKAGGERVVGTAWLAMAPGTLVTAAHVLLEEAQPSSGVSGSRPPQVKPIDSIRVQFPSGSPHRVKLKAGPILDKDRGVDVAVLEIEGNIEPERSPLPMILVNNPHGDVLVCGYGENLPNAQQLGFGSLLRTYFRRNVAANYLLQYTSHQLTFRGWSGAAVYSLDANAVVGLQTESSPKSDEVLAVPLSRIPEYWEELTTVAAFSTRARCVVLVPDVEDDEFVEQIAKPVLDDVHLEIHISTKGATLEVDLEKLDAADIVIADATVDDSYVTRELTIAQGLGTPDIVVRTQPVIGKADQSSLYLDLSKPAVARAALRSRIVEALAVYEAVGELVSKNPITSFFGAPLTRVSAANALAVGYFKNFVQPVGHAICLAQLSRDVTIKVAGEVVHASDYERVLLQVVLPSDLKSATDSGSEARRRLQEKVRDASINSGGWSRERELKVLVGSVGTERLVLMDVFPTTLVPLRESINERFERSKWEGVQWKIVERKEIDRFSRAVGRKIREDEFTATDLQLTDVCFVVTESEAFGE
jgi:hypothetical protein